MLTRLAKAYSSSGSGV